LKPKYKVVVALVPAPRLFLFVPKFPGRRDKPADVADQVIERVRNQISDRGSFKCDNKVVKPAIPVIAIHPAFTLNRAVNEAGCSGGILSKSVRPFP
jgi:hypothetical protein